MRYVAWVDRVFAGFVAASSTPWFSLSAVAEASGFPGLTYDDFAKHDGVANAFMTAAFDLDEIGLVKFANVSYGNELTRFGRDVGAAGLSSIWSRIADIALRPDEQAFLAKLYDRTHVEAEDWADLIGADAAEMYSELEPNLDGYTASMRRMTLLGDLDAKGLIRRVRVSDIGEAYRPTYVGVVRVSELKMHEEVQPGSATGPAGATPDSNPGAGSEAKEGRLYDVALSFAGEQRDYVQRVADVLTKQGVKVFYDEYEKATLWGKNLYDHLADVYGNRARFVVIFASADYARKAWTNHERQSAQARALKEKTEYVLPARFDDTSIPGLPDTVGYVDLRKTSPEELAGLIVAKLGDQPTGGGGLHTSSRGGATSTPNETANEPGSMSRGNWCALHQSAAISKLEALGKHDFFEICASVQPPLGGERRRRPWSRAWLRQTSTPSVGRSASTSRAIRLVLESTASSTRSGLTSTTPSTTGPSPRPARSTF